MRTRFQSIQLDGEKIRKSREISGLTQDELGRIIGVDSQTISRYETGLIKNPKLQMIEALSNALHLTFQDLVLSGKLGVRPANRPVYASWIVWLRDSAPADLTDIEKVALEQLQFANEPEPWRYTAILDHLRASSKKARREAERDEDPPSHLRKIIR